LRIPITTSDQQCSGAVYTPAQVALWRSTPPFTTLNVATGQGVATPLGWIHDSVLKGTAAAGTAGYVELHIDSLSTDDVAAVDVKIDGASDSTSATVRYTTATGTLTSANLHLLRFLIPAPIFRRSPSTSAVDSVMGCF
jgi:hypothetical protein